MANEGKTSWALDLDVSDAAGELQDFKDKINELGESSGLTDLATKFGEVSLVVGTIGAAVFALKETFDLVFDAEEIKAVDQQFELLSAHAGVLGETLKAGLEEAAGGLVDETTLLKGANQALVEMNGTADELPEIMTVARKATAVFGGDLMTNFNGITQAIASGNTRMLKHLGIVVDQQKAYKDYAASIGVAVDELDQAGKQHAVLNAVLKQSETAFAGVDVNVKQATNLWQEMKVSFKELGEVFTLFFGSVFGPTVEKAISVLKSFADNLKGIALSVFGDENQKAAEKIKTLHATLDDATKQVDFYQKQLEHPTKFQSVEALTKALDFQKSRIEQASKDLEKYEQKKEEGDRKIASSAMQTNALIVKDDGVNQAQRLKNAQKFAADLDKLREQSLSEELKNTQSMVRVEEIRDEQIAALNRKDANERKKLETEMVGHEAQKNAMLVELDKKKESQMLAIDMGNFKKKQDLLKTELDQARTAEKVDEVLERQKDNIRKQSERERIRAISQHGHDEKRLADELVAIERRKEQQIKAIDDNSRKQEDAADAKFVQDADGRAEQIARAYSAAASQAAKNVEDMSDVGSQAFSALGTSATAAFSAMGSGSEDAGKAMLKALLSSLGQLAISKGSMFILSGIAEFNPAEVAAGGALVALGSFMEAQAGGGTSTPAPSTGGSSSSNSSQNSGGPNTSGTAGAGPSTGNANPQQNVNFIIQGNMYSSNEAKKEMMALVRGSGDATGYKLTEVGTTR